MTNYNDDRTIEEQIEDFAHAMFCYLECEAEIGEHYDHTENIGDTGYGRGWTREQVGACIKLTEQVCHDRGVYLPLSSLTP